MKRRRFLPVLLLAAACGAPAPGPSVDEPRANPQGTPIILISIDTLRADRLPAYGYAGVETPAIDALRADGMLFTRAYAHVPLTFPSHVSLLSGQWPSTTGIRDNAGYRLEEGYAPYLPKLLGEAGYASGAFVSSYALRADTGVGQGFALYDDRFDDNDTDLLFGAERLGNRTLDALLPWLDTVAEQPFFLLFHLYEPHQPYTPPEPFLSRYGETYEAEIAAADAVIQRFLDALKSHDLYDRSLIVLLSDHGEGFDEHGEKGHGVLLYRESIHVPLIVKRPQGRDAGRQVDAPVQLVDIAPTVLATAGLPASEDMVGRSLFQVAEDPVAQTDARPVYMETVYPRIHFGWSDLASLIVGRFHYIESPNPELYDLVDDPDETVNLLASQRRRYHQMRDQLGPLRLPFEPPTAVEDEETIKKLAALGYLTASPNSATDGPLPDPRAMLAEIGPRMDAAMERFRTGDYAAAIPAFRELLELNPQMSDIWQALANALYHEERFDEALEVLEQTMTLTAGAPNVAFLTGRVLLKLGRLDEAMAHADLADDWDPALVRELRASIAVQQGDLGAALRHADVPAGETQLSTELRRRIGMLLIQKGRAPEAVPLLRAVQQELDNPAVWNALALALIEAGQPAEAPGLLAKVLDENPSNPRALESRGLLALHQGRAADALRDLEQVVAAKPNANAWNLIAVARFQSGDTDGALEAWQQAVAQDPQHYDALYNLAFTALRAGRADLARQALRQYLDRAPPARFARELDQARIALNQLEAP